MPHSSSSTHPEESGTAAQLQLPAASLQMPVVTTPGGTAILFEPIPGASLEDIRKRTKSMRARLVMPVGVRGPRFADPAAGRPSPLADWANLAQVGPMTAPAPQNEGLSMENSYFNASMMPIPSSGTTLQPLIEQPTTAQGGNGSSSTTIYEVDAHTAKITTSTGAVSLLQTAPSVMPVLGRSNSATVITCAAGSKPSIALSTPLDVPLVTTVTANHQPIEDAVPASGKPSAGTYTLKKDVLEKKKQGSGSLSALFGERNLTPPINVLIVEDNPINQAILSTFLRKRKIRYSLASNGQEAVDKWACGGFHLVLMDIQLPVMDGIQATKLIRRKEKERKIGVYPLSPPSSLPNLTEVAITEPKSDKKTEMICATLPSPPTSADAISPQIKREPRSFLSATPRTSLQSPVIIVALTASSLQSDRNIALAAGCNDFLTKPVSLVWLEKKIMEWGCMQALIDFEGWRKWKIDAGKQARKTSTKK